MNGVGHSGNGWIVAAYIVVLCVVVWIVYLSVRHVRNSFVLGSSDVGSDQYTELENVAGSESDHRHHS